MAFAGGWLVLPPLNSRAALLLGLIYLAFISLGLPDGSFGVAWPAIYPDLRLPIGLAGVILTVGTLFSAASGFSSAQVLRRWSTGPVVLVSGLLTSTAILVISRAQSAVWLFAAAVPLGLGAGAVDASVNGFVARHYSGRHMNWMHACWGIGATCGPLLVGYAMGAGHGWRGGYVALGSIQLTLAVFFALTLGWWKSVPEQAPAATKDGAAVRAPDTAANSLAGWLSAAIFAFYVAVEMTTGVWASTVLVVSRGVSAETAAVCAACFYGSITGGRILVGFLVDRVGNRRLVAVGSLVAAGGLLGFALARTAPAAGAALILAGLGLAPIYPGLMHEVPRRFAAAAVQTVIGRQSGAANLGAAVLPALAGLVAEYSVAGIPWVVLAAVGAVIASIRLLDRLT